MKASASTLIMVSSPTNVGLEVLSSIYGAHFCIGNRSLIGLAVLSVCGCEAVRPSLVAVSLGVYGIYLLGTLSTTEITC